MLNVEITKTGTENVLATIRKFSRRVSGANLVKIVRANRYYARKVSDATKKKSALKRIERRNERNQLIKEGKISEAPQRRGAPMHNREASTSQQPARFGESTPIAR